MNGILALNFQPTVIVPKPLQTTRVIWNEFPQEERIELEKVPKFKAQEWSPNKQVVSILIVNTFLSLLKRLFSI